MIVKSYLTTAFALQNSHTAIYVPGGTGSRSAGSYATRHSLTALNSCRYPSNHNRLMDRASSSRQLLSSIKAVKTDTLPKVYAWSDLHVDYSANYDRLKALKPADYPNACLMLPGDLTAKMDLLKESLLVSKSIFEEVLFVPGNHDIWVGRDGRYGHGRCNGHESGHESGQTVQQVDSYDSVEKFHDVLALCDSLDVKTYPVHYQTDSEALTLVPLYSWYVRGSEGEDSLFQPRSFENHPAAKWSDFEKCLWPEDLTGAKIDRYFDQFNDVIVESVEGIDLPIGMPHHKISMSHFVPDARLLFTWITETEEALLEAAKQIIPKIRFNFSDVAGSKSILRRVEQVGSDLHIYGHHHRKRIRDLGPLFVNAALGNIREFERGLTQGEPVKVFPALEDKSYLDLLAWQTDPDVRTEGMRERNRKSDVGE